MNLERLELRLSDIVAAPTDDKIDRLADALGDEIPRGRLDVLRRFRSMTAKAIAVLNANHPKHGAMLHTLNTVCAAAEASLDKRYDWREPKHKNLIIEAWPETPSRAVYFLKDLDVSAWSNIIRLGDEALTFLGLSDIRRHADPELEEALRLETLVEDVGLVIARPLGATPTEISIGRYVFPLVKVVGAGQGTYLDLVQPSPLRVPKPHSKPPVDTDRLPWP